MEKVEDLTAKAQQRHRQGRILDAIKCFEKALDRRIDLLGPDDKSVKRACEQLCDVLNGAALKYLQNEEYENAREMLQKAEALTGPDDLVTSVTYNNMACYFRRRGKLRTALAYLEKAQRIEMRSRVVANPAGTRLNLCAVLSQLERHQEARDHAQAAVFLLQEELSRLSLDSDDGMNSQPEVLNKMAVLAISYHNIGVEEEYLRRHAESLEAYQRGVEIARTYLGPENDIAKTLVKSCIAAQEHLDASRQRKPLVPQGQALNGPYEAMQQHNYPRRRAQSAGSTRSHSATPSWALNSSVRSAGSAGSTKSTAASQLRSRVSSATTREANTSSALSYVPGASSSALSHFPAMRDPHTSSSAAQRPASAIASYKPDAGAGPCMRQRPGSAFAVLGGSQPDRRTTRSALKDIYAPGVGVGGVKRGPVTPRFDSGSPMSSGISRPASGVLRPASASTRQPVRANLSMFQREPAPVPEENGDGEERARTRSAQGSTRQAASASSSSSSRRLDREQRSGGEEAAARRRTYDGSSDLMLERPQSLGGSQVGGRERPSGKEPRRLARHAEKAEREDREEDLDEEELSVAEDKDSSLDLSRDDDDDDDDDDLDLSRKETLTVKAKDRDVPKARGVRSGVSERDLRSGRGEREEEGNRQRGGLAGGGGRRRYGEEEDLGSGTRGVAREAFGAQERSERIQRPARPSDTAGRGRGGRAAVAEQVKVLTETEESKYTSSEEEAEEEEEVLPRAAPPVPIRAERGGGAARYGDARREESSASVRTPDGRKWKADPSMDVRAARESGSVSRGEDEEDEEAVEVVAPRGLTRGKAAPRGGKARGGGEQQRRSTNSGSQRSNSLSLRDSELDLELSGSEEEEVLDVRKERERASNERERAGSNQDQRSKRPPRAAAARSEDDRKISMADAKLRELRAMADAEDDVEISADSGSGSELGGGEDEEYEEKAKGEERRRAESLKWVEFDLQR